MRSETRTQHLTDAEFSQLLDGAQPGSRVEAHLLLCALCREELEVVQGSLTDFRTLGSGWAEVQAPRHIPVPARWAERYSMQTSWSAGLATTALTGLLVFWLGFAPHAKQNPALRTAVTAPTNAELAADNRLLLSIDDELTDQSQPVLTVTPSSLAAQQTAHHPVGTITD